jgi:hypothetical protein
LRASPRMGQRGSALAYPQTPPPTPGRRPTRSEWTSMGSPELLRTTRRSPAGLSKSARSWRSTSRLCRPRTSRSGCRAPPAPLHSRTGSLPRLAFRRMTPDERPGNTASAPIGRSAHTLVDRAASRRAMTRLCALSGERYLRSDGWYPTRAERHPLCSSANLSPVRRERPAARHEANAPARGSGGRRRPGRRSWRRD